MRNTACKIELQVVHFTVDRSKEIISNEQAISLIFSQKTWSQYFPALIYMSNFL